MKLKTIPLQVFFYLFLSLLIGCKGVKKVAAKRDLNITINKSPLFNNQFTGFVLFDPAEQQMLYDHNGHLLFTPASNTKILTALSCLESIKDSIPSALIKTVNDTVHLYPFGDPTVLHPDFKDQFWKKPIKGKHLLVHLPDSPLTPYGSGWAWDDYQYDFQVERSWMPTYGNEVRIIKNDSLKVTPDFFDDYIQLFVGEKPGNLVYRERDFNLFNIWMDTDTSTFERKIPFETSQELLSILLNDTLGIPVEITNDPMINNADTLYNSALLPTLSLMMLRSDNFLAEQLLVVSSMVSGYESVDAYRNHQLAKWNLRTNIRWVDGSGLSRYNLISPIAFVDVLNKVYRECTWDELSNLFPTGGVSGTIKNWYGAKEPYVFAKTGTLSNNHNLSGYLKTQSGKVLIFSFMNNHYMRPVSEVKMEMQKVLEIIRDGY